MTEKEAISLAEEVALTDERTNSEYITLEGVKMLIKAIYDINQVDRGRDLVIAQDREEFIKKVIGGEDV